MKVILLQDIRGKGKKGQMIEASDGYARNFLLPRKMAIEATADNVNTMKMNDKAKAEQAAREKAQAQEIAGSQIPMDNMLTDARNNLFCALAAVEADIQGVSVAFNRHIIRGCRAVKVRTMGFDAFESVNARYLGEIFADGLRVYNRQIPASQEKTELYDRVSTDVFLLKLIPNTNPRLFDHLAEIGYRGVVLETFGAGGMHFHRRDLLEKLRMLEQKGIVVVACSQCLYEPSNFTIYEVGRKLLETGVIPAGDMTTEAAVTKLMWALGQTDEPEKVKEIFSRNYTGEISE